MGNDGGSIPTRRELVKEAARNPTTQQVKETLNEQQDHLWNVDPLSQKPLCRPIVSDALGRLFSKESILEYLLPSEEEDAVSKAEQAAFLQGTIAGLKDVVELKLEVGVLDPKSKIGGTRRAEKWLCPITGQELGPGAKAVYIVPCGHVFAGAAIKEISGNECLVCNKAYAENDLIPILPTLEADVARLSLRIKTLKEKGLSHSLKGSADGAKKRKKLAAAAVESTEDHPAKPSERATQKAQAIKNASTATLTQKVLAEQDERNKRRKMDKNDNLSSLFAKKLSSTDQKRPSDIDFMNRGYSIPNRN